MPAISNIPCHNCSYEKWEGIWWDGRKNGTMAYSKKYPSIHVGAKGEKTKKGNGMFPVKT
jgi:hypothetical protein